MTSLRLKRGTTLQNSSYTGPSGELTMDTTSNQVRLHDGTTAGGVTVGSLNVTSVKTSAYNANVNELVRIDSTTGSFTITLPATPPDGARISFIDVANQCGTNPVLVAANGKTILGDSTGISLDANGAGLSLIFNNLTNEWSNINMFSSSFGITPSLLNFTGFGTPSFVNGYTAYSGGFHSIAVNYSGRFVAVGNRVNPSDSFNHALTAYSDDGITWSTPSLMNGYTSTSITMTGVTVNSAGLFVAVGYHMIYGYFYSATSTDGITWTTPQVKFDGTYLISNPTVAVNNSGLFVAVGEDKSTTSTDGINWTTPITITVTNLQNITVTSSNQFIAIGGTNSIPKYAISTNGINWTYGSIGTQLMTQCNGIAVNSTGLIIVTGYNSNNYPVYYTSNEGTTWSNQNFFNNYQQTNYIQSITVGPSGRFIVVGSNVSGLWSYTTSADGITWATPTSISGSSGIARSNVSNSNGRFVAVGTYFDKPGYMYSIA